MRLKSSFAGMFYPESPRDLDRLLDALLAEARQQERIEGKILGAVVPHAGYVYSGQGAAMAWSFLENADVESVLIMAPSHRNPIGPACLFDIEGFETVLGSMDCDADGIERLSELASIPRQSAFAEHALEVQLPFLRKVLPRAEFIPLLMGTPDPRFAQQLAVAIEILSREKKLAVIASTDLSHYHSRSKARGLDDRFRQTLEDLDIDGMWNALQEGEAEACGAGGVMTLMHLARLKESQVKIVDQRDSSEVSGESDQVVGYLAAVIAQAARTQA